MHAQKEKLSLEKGSGLKQIATQRPLNYRHSTARSISDAHSVSNLQMSCNFLSMPTSPLFTTSTSMLGFSGGGHFRHDSATTARRDQVPSVTNDDLLGIAEDKEN